MSIEDGICPQCGELLVYPKNDDPYCEDCGWPDEDFELMQNQSIPNAIKRSMRGKFT